MSKQTLPKATDKTVSGKKGEELKKKKLVMMRRTTKVGDTIYKPGVWNEMDETVLKAHKAKLGDWEVK